MIKIVRLGAAVVSALTPTGGIVRAQAEREFLRPAQAAKMLADSRPWSATKKDGRDATVSFNPDGSGTFKGGPFALSTKWEIKGEDICITMSVTGVTCHRFVRVAGGLDGYTNGALDLQLRR
ncbi:hypothetical protein [Bradyrhizobium iriomotense]|uniref:hypothetical protein n=1 Tax=Bradyrhizobium iriomotense TaxID=441950 RepID=UPI001B8A7A15|nr:hypothetical protein [Bradyrhizobium iriomotense]MBR1132781.1 hypothetical protein [Bradyrhizobium iriomotense]